MVEHIGFEPMTSSMPWKRASQLCQCPKLNFLTNTYIYSRHSVLSILARRVFYLIGVNALATVPMPQIYYNYIKNSPLLPETRYFSAAMRPPGALFVLQCLFCLQRLPLCISACILLSTIWSHNTSTLHFYDNLH